MKTYLYLTTAVAGMMIGGNAWSQCVSTQDCTALGYTETSCPKGGVKCPFGSKWFCGGDSTTICKQEGFTNACTGTGQLGKGESCANLYKQCDCQSTYKYACSGTGYSGGSGTACGGKYTACTCSSGYTWDATEEACKAQDTCSSTCGIGCLYYSDGTCSQDKLSSKTLLGVVIYEKSASQNGWIMTHKPVATTIAWGSYGTDIPGLTNYTSTPTDIQASCTNTDVITAYGSSSKYPAAWAAKNYKPTGTPSGKSWCLPSGGLLNNINNSVNFAKVNAGITIAGGTIPVNVYSGAEFVWSSSEYDRGSAWYFGARTSGLFSVYYYNKHDDFYGSVRPVLAF